MFHSEFQVFVSSLESLWQMETQAHLISSNLMVLFVDKFCLRAVLPPFIAAAALVIRNFPILYAPLVYDRGYLHMAQI